HAGKQADQLFAVDRAATVQPGAIAANQKRKIAAFHGGAAWPLTSCRRGVPEWVGASEGGGHGLGLAIASDGCDQRRGSAGVVHVSVSITDDLPSLRAI